MKDVGDGAGVAGGGGAVADVDLERVALEAGMRDRQVLRDDHGGERPVALGHEHQHLHRAALYLDAVLGVHRAFPSLSNRGRGAF